ncbi:hypothetical protein RHMOL_Rhmol09G0217900 [Rhododendron molle]|uniref:Uncharacterized protein n=1 Tax=Rhododendron molle TaxID=49168 RepID=A0ACC0MH50_RHOML|nr:hypothetical protein RHMOL_Rhmol09G0217900 [Rhododendron molle]
MEELRKRYDPSSFSWVDFDTVSVCGSALLSKEIGVSSIRECWDCQTEEKFFDDDITAPNLMLVLCSLKVVRLSIAQVLTVVSQKQKAALREVYTNKKYLPLDLRPKKTRAIRRRLTKHQISLKTEREKKKELYYPMRKYAIKV